jgi:hypothetical protein
MQTGNKQLISTFTLANQNNYFMKKTFTAFLLMAMATACTNQNRNIGHGTWLRGDQEHFVEAIEHQFDGFSRTMQEVHYRYGELYWAGQDENWEYTDYQLEHIDEAMEKGIERRPERKKNSEEFLGAPHDILQQAIDSKDKERFNRAFRMYHAACQSCHIKEDVAFIKLIIPEHRSGHTRF